MSEPSTYLLAESHSDNFRPYIDVYTQVTSRRTLTSVARPGEATDDQLDAFAYALKSHLRDGDVSVSQLAAKIGVNRNTIYLWRDGKREPQRSQVFKLEKGLVIPSGSLSYLLGYIPIGGTITVETVIRHDRRLDPEDQERLVAEYRRLRGIAEVTPIDQGRRRGNVIEIGATERRPNAAEEGEEVAKIKTGRKARRPSPTDPEPDAP
jgi:transcriptional regulator with XRE-family HTH domain